MRKIIILLALIIQGWLGFSQPMKNQLFDPESIKINLLFFNTEWSDFGPALIGDSLYFTSFTKFDKNAPKSKQNEIFYDLFVSTLDETGNISDKREVINQFSKNYHNGPVSWCPATKELFITQSNYLQSGAVFKPFRRNYYNLQIVVAKQENGSWKITENFPFNNPKYSVGHPSISSSGDTLIFSSNKPGGLGETDLYMSLRKNGKWSEPVNLGPRINTKGKDEFPFLSNHGDLLFASNGRNGFGGLDLYFTKLNNPKGEVYQFNKPINSEYDDFSMIILPERNIGYLSSNRPGYGGDDIYKLTYNRVKINYLQLAVLDAKTLKPLTAAETEFSDGLKLNTDELGEITRKISDEFPYQVNVKAIGYFNGSKNIKTGILKSGAVFRDTILLKTLDKERYVIHNLYFDYNKWNLLTESMKELDHLIYYLANNPETKVNLGAHADARGTNEYNEKLSELRMKSVVDYLIKRGIDPDRIDGRSYGESVPLNNCADPANCTPQELRLNRRVEFFIAELGKSEIVDQEGKGDYTEMAGLAETSEMQMNKPLKHSIIIGSFKIKTNAEKIMNQLKKNGFEPEILNYNDFFIVKIGFKDSQSAREEYKKLKEKYQGATLL